MIDGTQLNSVTLEDLVSALSSALDVTSHGMAGHHRRVAYLSLRMGEAVELPPARLRLLFLAAVLHDVGAILVPERERGARGGLPGAAEARAGAEFLRSSPALAHIADVVEHSRRPFTNGGAAPLESRIVAVADAVDRVIVPDAPILAQRAEIERHLVAAAGREVDPALVEAFRDLAAAEGFWLEVVCEDLGASIAEITAEWTQQPIAGETMIEVARVFANLIDVRSAFTARHSACVAEIAATIASAAGMTGDDVREITAAALLHDLGKLAVPSELLERPGPLTPDEMLVMRQHPYHTGRILGRIRGFRRIRRWAAQHHERMDGRGYPFRIEGRRLSLGSRIMAVADVFTALAEDRPYRQGLSLSAAGRILRSLVAERALCPDVVALALELFEEMPKVTVAPDWTERLVATAPGSIDPVPGPAFAGLRPRVLVTP